LHAAVHAAGEARLSAVAEAARLLKWQEAFWEISPSQGFLPFFFAELFSIGYYIGGFAPLSCPCAQSAGAKGLRGSMDMAGYRKYFK
jgi:hypothetical protein